MIQSVDYEGRLRLFRYGLVVILIVTFLVSLLAPYAITAPYASQVVNPVAQQNNVAPINIGVTTFLSQALIITIIVGVILAVIYYFYRRYLLNSTTTRTTA
jgi:hypothetical protein